MDADALVQLLPVAAALDRTHHDVLRRHEGQLLEHMLADNFVVDLDAACDVEVDIQNRVDREESLGDGDAAVRCV